MDRVGGPHEVDLDLDAFPLSPGRTTSAANRGGNVVDISMYDDLEVALSEASGVRPVVAGATLLHPGRADAEHAWPATRWSVVAEDATAAGHHVVVLARDGVRATGSPWWTDSLEVRSGQSYDVAFVADNPGIWMDHCHNLPHATQGLVAHLMYAGVTTPFRVGHADNHPE